MTRVEPHAAPGTPLVRLTRESLRGLLGAAAGRLPRPARLLLVGESALVAAGVRDWTDRLVFAVDADAPAGLDGAVRDAAAVHRVEAERESPADVVPVPPGFAERARALEGWADLAPLEVLAFDPLSVAIRLVARGNEPDYHTVLAFLRHGWLTMDDLESALAGVLPLFSTERIQQDPAEFRRKFKGLRQMWRALAAARVP